VPKMGSRKDVVVLATRLLFSSLVVSAAVVAAVPLLLLLPLLCQMFFETDWLPGRGIAVAAAAAGVVLALDGHMQYFLSGYVSLLLLFLLPAGLDAAFSVFTSLKLFNCDGLWSCTFTNVLDDVSVQRCTFRHADVCFEKFQ